MSLPHFYIHQRIEMTEMSDEATAAVRTRDILSPEPESLVLVIMTGGTICMRRSPNGLIPERGFLEKAMAPRPEFNDGLHHNPLYVRTNDVDPPKKMKSLRTPVSAYGKQVR
jgi:60kDa lysophospholipase